MKNSPSTQYKTLPPTYYKNKMQQKCKSFWSPLAIQYHAMKFTRPHYQPIYAVEFNRAEFTNIMAEGKKSWPFSLLSLWMKVDWYSRAQSGGMYAIEMCYGNKVQKNTWAASKENIFMEGKWRRLIMGQTIMLRWRAEWEYMLFNK